MKKLTAIFCALALIFSFAACAKTETGEETLSGIVEAIDGNTLTLMTGMAPGGNMQAGTPPDMPGGDTNGMQQGGNPPEMPGGDMGSMQQGGNPPEKPDGDMGGMQQGGNPPEMPDGDMGGMQQGDNPPEMPGNMGNPPEKPDGTDTQKQESRKIDIKNAEIKKADGSKGSKEDITVGAMVTVTLSGNKAKTVTLGGGFGGSENIDHGSSANTIDSDGEFSEKEYFSTGDNENALRIDGAAVTLDGVKVSKDGGNSANPENGDFYGVNAALLVMNGAAAEIKNAVVTSNAQNGNGVFCYGKGTTVNISDSKITTLADNSGGIQTTGGGTMNASSLTVETSGNSSAAIRSDRGGGTVNVDGGSYISNGSNSPAVYSTANITVCNADLKANSSEALVIEGKNSISLENCTVSGNMDAEKSVSGRINVHNIMIYQSMSGDADVGTSALSVKGSTVTGFSGDMIFVTNTHCKINLTDSAFISNSDGALLRVTGNNASFGWGTAGKNGGMADVTCTWQELEGDIIVDSISNLNLSLTEGSTFTGTVNIIDNAEGGEAVKDNAKITIDDSSVWSLTGDCVISSLENNGTIKFNGHTITLADGTKLTK